MNQTAIDTLFLPIEMGQVAFDEASDIVFCEAVAHPLLSLLPKSCQYQQGFFPEAARLERLGLKVRSDYIDTPYDLIVTLLPKQREEGRAAMARALLSLKVGGTCLFAADNSQGARTSESDLKSFGLKVTSLSKHKARAFWAQYDQKSFDDPKVHETIAAWLSAFEPRPIHQGDLSDGLMSQAGLFAYDRLDQGTKCLIQALPHGLSGTGADLGGGTGVITRFVLGAHPMVSHMDLFEAQSRAVALARGNLSAFEGRFACHWADATQLTKGAYDFVVMNPPFHSGRADDNALGQGFITAAALMLKPRGSLFMVANRHLPYEAHLKAHFKRVESLFEDKAYKVYKAQKA